MGPARRHVGYLAWGDFPAPTNVGISPVDACQREARSTSAVHSFEV